MRYARKKQFEDAHFIAISLAIILFSALPLVALIFVFPSFGYDTYFHSRHYYTPGVGAAMLFPFLIISLALFVSKTLHIKNFFMVVLLLSFIYTTSNVSAFIKAIRIYTGNYSAERMAVVKQLTSFLPKLRQKTVFYIEHDGKSPFDSLPFFTSVPQALTVVYFERGPLPDSFYEKPLFSGKPQGYQYENGRGFGYFISKKDLVDAIIANQFNSHDVYGYYYYEKAKLKDITPRIRKEIKKYELESKQNAGWKKFINTDRTFSFLYPPDTNITEGSNFVNLSSQTFDAKLFFTIVPQNFDSNNYIQIHEKFSEANITQKKASFDTYHFNDVYTMENDLVNFYYLKLHDTLFYLQVEKTNTESIPVLEKVLGSITVIKKE